MQKIILTTLIFFTLIHAFQILPDNSQQFKAYAIGSGGIFLWYEFAEIVTDEWWIKYPVAIMGSCFTGIILTPHLEGNEAWFSTGKFHGLGLRISIDLIKIFTKKKDKVAYAETIRR